MKKLSLLLIFVASLAHAASYTPSNVVFSTTAVASAATGSSTSAQSLIGVGLNQDGTTAPKLPVNFFYTPGTSVRITSQGFGSNGTISAQTLTFTLKFGSTTVAASAAITPITTATNYTYQLDCLITALTVGSSGTVEPNCSVTMTGSGNTPAVIALANTSAVTINTTTSQAVTWTATWGGSGLSSSQTITGTAFAMELLPSPIPQAAAAAYTLVGVDYAVSTGSITSLQTAGFSSTTGDAFAISIMEAYPINVTGCTDTAGDTITLQSNVPNSGNTLLEQVGASLTITGNASNKVTCSFSGTSSFNNAIVVLYFHRATGTWTFDTFQNNSTSLSGVMAGSLGTNTMTTANAAEIVVSCIALDSAFGGGQAITAGTIAAHGATLGKVAGASTTGPLGCQYYFTTSSFSGGNAIMNVPSSDGITTSAIALK